MSFMNDPGLKLFGKIIQVNSKDTNWNLNVDDDISDFSDDNCHNKECIISNDNLDKCENRGNFEETICEASKNQIRNSTLVEDGTLAFNEKVSKNQIRNSTFVEDGTLAFNEKVCSSQYSHNKDGNDQTSSTDQNGQQQLKNPEKILPCPRCNSMSTKFCYFNNYNVNQPRHFCKDCQRYWTAGGTMRNVPVGAGRRKSKSSVASQHRHLLVPRVASELRTLSYDSYVSPLFFKNGGPVQVSCFRGLVGFPVTYSDQSVTTCSSPTSSTSRKHSRDGAMLNFSSSDGINKDVTWDGKSTNGQVVIPKTLKVDDPIEASNSSIWSTLRGKNNCNGSDSNAKGEFFGGLHEINSRSSEPLSMVLDLNPAAFSRSLSFHEMAP